jgi:large subunit ribosomal protein L18
VYRSNTRIAAQLIDDAKHVTIVSGWVKGRNVATATQLGKELAEKAKAKNITTVVFDRGGFRYHGVIKAVAESAREGGLVF